MPKPVLYHVPPSFYSQVVRLALAEKGVDYESRYVIPGPASFESYAPWYMRLNPGGTVPTLIHNGRVIPDSRDILHYLDTRFPMTTLRGNCSTHIEVDRFVGRLYAVSFRELSYGSPRLRKLGAFLNKKRVRNLQKRRAENPDLSETYSAKISDIEAFSRKAQDPRHVEQVRSAVERQLDQLNTRLACSTYLVGEDYTMADLVWTVGIARLIMLGSKPLDNRTALKDWYERMRLRPSFTQAGVMERFRPSAILRVLWSKLTSRNEAPPQQCASNASMNDNSPAL